MRSSIKVKVDVALVAAVIRGSGKKYVTARQISRMLGVSTRTAGRILARLESEGYLVRWSRRSYKVNFGNDYIIKSLAYTGRKG